METAKTTNKEKTAITVEINADTTQLKKELAEIETTIDRIAEKMKNLKTLANETQTNEFKIVTNGEISAERIINGLAKNQEGKQ